MKRYTGQKALYEAIARTRAKSQRRGILERLYPGGAREEPVAPPAADEPEPQPPVRVEPVKPPEPKPVVVEKAPAPVAKPVRPVMEEPKPQPHPRPVQPWLRPKAVQLHDGRIEVSLPYTLGITVLLGAILLILGAFRLGQTQRRVQPTVAESSAPVEPKPVALKVSPAPAMPEAPTKAETPAPAPTVAETPSTDTGTTAVTAPVAKPGDHVIVVAQTAQREPLMAVQAFFKEHGVALKIVDVEEVRKYLEKAGLNTRVLGSRRGYLLVTEEWYDNPESSGTNGFKVKQQIIEIGKSYRNAPGSNVFAPRYFSDAYGMRIR